ncbi:hypothetical protein P3T37_004706 [Kitasatospora sp. MAA4]|uniref:Rv3235 family protein n=1 Tax=Kitasatospora sp. MAA4 TaxID=3035093 RepID=UPI0024772600|nr:Rv3235 family protein [Kitasatospora sp. MAA4]MDH6135296.1 hypothetical protein [Kitasatospora sp. MAA4]
MPETAIRSHTVPPQITPLAVDPLALASPAAAPAAAAKPAIAQPATAQPVTAQPVTAPPAPACRGAAPRRPRHPRSACSPSHGGGTELAARFALRLVEVLTGARPAGQLTRHTTHDGYRQLAQLVHGGPVHDFAPGPGALEVCVRVDFGPRHHMVAFRLEQHRNTEQWQCAAVDAR